MWISHPDTCGLVLPQTLLREMLGSSAQQALPSSCLAKKGKESPSAVSSLKTPQNNNADSLCSFGNISYSCSELDCLEMLCAVAQSVLSLLPVQEELLTPEQFGSNTPVQAGKVTAKVVATSAPRERSLNSQP